MCIRDSNKIIDKNNDSSLFLKKFDHIDSTQMYVRNLNLFDLLQGNFFYLKLNSRKSSK